jgi:hypothetical protein
MACGQQPAATMAMCCYGTLQDWCPMQIAMQQMQMAQQQVMVIRFSQDKIAQQQQQQRQASQQ